MKLQSNFGNAVINSFCGKYNTHGRVNSLRILGGENPI